MILVLVNLTRNEVENPKILIVLCRVSLGQARNALAVWSSGSLVHSGIGGAHHGSEDKGNEFHA